MFLRNLLRISFRKALLRAVVPLLGLVTTSTAVGQTHHFRVTQGGTNDPLSESPVPIVAGQPFEVRVAVFEAGAPIDEPYTAFNRDVTLELHGQFGQVVTVDVPADQFLDGVAEFVEVIPFYAGTGIMRFRVTDGNLVTDNASGYFSIDPAGFRVTYVGGDQALSAHDILVNRPVMARVSALNADLVTVAAGFRGFVLLESSNGLLEPTAVEIGFGGISDYMHQNPQSAQLTFIDIGDDEIILASLDGETFTEASVPFSIIPAGTNSAEISIDRVELVGSAPEFPGSTRRVRYRLNNEEDEDDAPPPAPIDTLFRLVDRGNNDRIILEWIEQHPGLAGDEDSGDLFTSFQFPQNLMGNGAAYRLEILPGYSTEEQEDLDFTIDTTPDLAIRGIIYPNGTYRGGDAIQFRAAFANNTVHINTENPASSVAHNQRYKLQIHLSADPEYGNEDDFLVWEQSYSGNGLSNRLLPGQQIDVEGAMMLPQNFEGTYYLLARINSAGGPDGTGFEPEGRDESVWGNNTTVATVGQRLTILPHQGTETVRASLSSDGDESDGPSDNAVVSADGRYVAFDSFGELANGVDSNVRNIFLRNVVGEATSLVSVGLAGPANGHSANPAISADGRYIVFQSNASNLVANDSNGYSDIFVRDRQEGTTTRLSLNPRTGAEPNHGSQLPRISADGRFVVFESTATNLMEGEPLSPGVRRVFLIDRDVADTKIFDLPGNTAITLVSKAGGEPSIWPSSTPRISSDGNFVTFVTRDPAILGGSSPFDQIVRWERGKEEFVVVSIAFGAPSIFGDNHSGYPAISGDGSYIAFASRAQNMTDPEMDTYEIPIPHVFRARIAGGEVTQIARLNTALGTEPGPMFPEFSEFALDLGSYEPSISDDGQLIAYTSEASNLLPPIPVHNLDLTVSLSAEVYNYADHNGAADVYLYEFTDDLQAPVIHRASVSSFGFGTNPFTYQAGTVSSYPTVSRRPAISPDGRFIAFSSDGKGHHGLIFGATNYIYSATNGTNTDIYLFDLKRGLTFPEDLPIVSLLMPDTLKAVAGQRMQLAARASTTVGSIQRVEFYVNNELAGVVPAGQVDFWGQYILNWTIPVLPGNPNPKTYTIAAIAVDSNDLRSRLSNVTRVTAAATSAGVNPVVRIIDPASGFQLTNRSEWPFVAHATSLESEIHTVEFFMDPAGGTGLGLSMGAVRGVSGQEFFQIEFDLNDLAALGAAAPFVPRVPPGAYSVTAVARDENGNIGRSDPVVISVAPAASDRPQLVNFSASKSAMSLTETVRVEVEILDPIPPMQGVVLFGNGEPIGPMTMLVGDFQPGKRWMWEGQLPSPGIWTLYAVGADAAGNFDVSDSRRVDVGRAVFRLDVAESVDLDQPTSIELEVVAGAVSIGWVEFAVDGTFLATDLNAPYAVQWTPSALGLHTITARVWDAEVLEYLPVPAVAVLVVPAPIPQEFIWQPQAAGAFDLNGVTKAGSRLVAVGDAGAVRRSSDGFDWSGGGSASEESLRSVAYGDGITIAVGDIAMGDDNHARIVYSDDDGLSWQAVPSGTPRRLLGVTYGEASGRKLFVAVGRAGVIRISRDSSNPDALGIVWENRASGTAENLNAVAHRPGGGGGVQFVAVGDNGTILTSIDGEHWTPQAAGTSAPLYDVTYANGRFVAAGGRWAEGSDSARILTSTDGINWTLSGTNIPSILHGVAFGGGSWVAVGTWGEVAVSANGVDWTSSRVDLGTGSPVPPALLDVVFDGTRFAAVGENGTVTVSDPANYATWVAQRYSPEQTVDPDVSGPDADPDGTGLPNLLRYALGIDGPDSIGHTPRMEVLWEPQPFLALEYIRPTSRQDVFYIVEASSNLIDWKPIESGGGSIDVTANGNLETVVARDGVNIDEVGGRRFLRLRVEVIE